MPLILLTTFTTVLIVIASWTNVAKRIAQYLAAFLILEGLMIGVFAALDAALFYVFWEAMLMPMFIIIGVWGGPRRVYATIKFFLYTFIGSLLMLVALIYMYLKSGSYELAVFQQHAADADRADLHLSWRSSPRSRSRCRCGRCTPGCRTRTSRRPPAAPWCWRPSC
jgi:NADH:ubiquinone oxidoreductase subunit 4 (subunit M)